MTLIGTILKKVQSNESVTRKYFSPPPEVREDIIIKKKEIPVYQYAHVKSCVDTSPPTLDPRPRLRTLARWGARLSQIYWENAQIVVAIRRQHSRGKVDCWLDPPKAGRRSYDCRRLFLKRVAKDNKYLYKILVNTPPRVATTESLRREWIKNKQEIVEGAQKTFVLFDTMPRVDDSAFKPPDGVKRPRVYIELGVGGWCLGELVVELFTETCPQTCRLFLELLAGDGLGHGYVGTCFYRKVPQLYWAGGDVIYNNGFGCYAQRGRRVPIGPENYHYPHSAPGLLSMRVTPNDEMCGGFNILFKALPHFDLRNVVFGRVIQPCSTYDVIQQLGSPLSSHPVVTITKTRLREGGRWVYGRPNERLKKRYVNVKKDSR